MQSKDIPEMQRLTILALRHYNDYCLFCRHANIEPAPIPEFITQTKSSLKYLNTKGTREKQNNQVQENKTHEQEYIGKFPDKPATEKQIKFLQNLGAQEFYQDLSILTRKQASQMISQLLGNAR